MLSIKPIDDARQSNKSDDMDRVHYFVSMKDYPCGIQRRPGYGQSTIILEDVTCRKCLDFIHERLMRQAKRVLILMGNIA